MKINKNGSPWGPLGPPTHLPGPMGPPRFFRKPSKHGSTRRRLRGQRNIPKTCSSGFSTGQKACTRGATTAFMFPEGDIFPDLPLRTLQLFGAHESSITLNDMFVDLCVLEPLDCRRRHTVVVRCWLFEAVSIFTLQVDPRYGDFHCDYTVLTYAHLCILSLMPQTTRR